MKPSLAQRAAPSTQVIPPISTSTVAGKGSFVLLVCGAALIFNHMGRPFEAVLVGYHIPAVICGIAIMAAILFGALRQFKHRIGLALVAYTGWITVSVPFSQWKGGSANYLAYHVALRVVLFLVVAAAARKASDVRKLMLVTAGTCLMSLLLGGTLFGGRFAGQGTWGNSDDVSLMAGFVLPLWMFAALHLRVMFLRIPIALAGGLFLLRALGLSGARSGLLALACVIGVYFLRSSGIKRLLIFLATLSLGAVFLASLPADIRNRYATIVDSFDSQRVIEMRSQSEAYESTASRKELIGDAIRMTLQHPVTGVGPGEFGGYRWNNFITDSGNRRRWFPSHNTYLQISSETGIPGLVAYLIFLAMIYRTILRVRAQGVAGTHPEAAEIVQAATAMELSFIYFAFCAFFMTCDIHPHIFLLAGIAVSAERMSLSGVPSPAAQPVARAMVSRHPVLGRSV